LQEHTSIQKSGRRRFLTKFHDHLSLKLQDLGLKCWLSDRQRYNWFTGNNFWIGKYDCIEKSCKNVFNASICKYSTLNDVFVVVKANEVSVHSSFVKKITSCRGAERRSLGKELLAFGNTKVKVENVLFNLNKSSDSNSILFPTGKVTSDNVLKQIKYEEKHINRYSSDIHRDIEAVKLATDELCGRFGYVQEISQNPFGYLTICELQV